ncbi:MAG: hypothetical protein HZA25_00580 [Candidatus Niyogibacteria bacterium]|nr:hypothetical protein [Candidatus Niyogibacteria bacterium]
MTLNPFERKFSMTPKEEDAAKMAGKTPEQIAEEKKRFDAATARAKEPGVHEISPQELEEASKPGAIDELLRKLKQKAIDAFDK